MNFISLSDSNINSSMSFGTENGQDIPEKNVNLFFNKQKGGDLGSLWPFSNENNNLALLACKKGEFSTLSFLIKENKIDDYSVQDENTGYTILHYVVAYFKIIPDNSNILNIILSRDDVSDFIDLQDYTNKNTPLHLAAMQHNNELCTKLIQAGANRQLENSNSLVVGSDNESTINGPSNGPSMSTDMLNKSAQKQTFATPSSESVFVRKNTGAEKSNPSAIDSTITDIVNRFMVPKSKTVNTEYSQELPNNLTAAEPKSPARNDSALSTSDFVDQLITQYGTKAKTTFNNMQNKAREYLPKQMPSFDNLMAPKAPMPSLDNSMAQKPQMTGGARSRNYIVGQRTMKSYNDYDDYSDVQDGGKRKNSKNRKQSRSMTPDSELGRAIENQAGKIHEDTIKKIQELMGVDEQTARIYKAALYKQVKDKNPELNNLDRAVEMQNLATEKNLKKIDVEATNKEMQAKFAENDK
jgi:hypothetical protein